ncbi:MAG: purine-binding chemotaxis protein CheW [Kofleriaceae bacterium]|nr:purine-binding chemotaxis protein CheW [Kofleriaceae bacterium]MCL4226713.1 chemotaxis protein CheW [Myxococcales bacterium]
MVESPSSGGSPPLRLVCFELRQQELALAIADVRETLPLLPITHVFLTPPWLAGIFSLRGEIVPAIDLGVLLGLPRTAVGDDARIVVVERGARVAGILVERLRELRTIDEAAVEAPPAGLPGEVAAILRGVVATPDGTVRVLDLDALLSSERLGALAREESQPA